MGILLTGTIVFFVASFWIPRIARLSMYFQGGYKKPFSFVIKCSIS